MSIVDKVMEHILTSCIMQYFGNEWFFCLPIYNLVLGQGILVNCNFLLQMFYQGLDLATANWYWNTWPIKSIWQSSSYEITLLDFYGIRGYLFTWLQSLNDNFQQVVVDGCFSFLCKESSGGSQGSTLLKSIIVKKWV